MNPSNDQTRQKTIKFVGTAAAAAALGAASWLAFKPGDRAASATNSAAPIAEQKPAAAPQAPRKTRTLTAEEIEATSNAKPCDNTVITDLDLSRTPTEAELIMAGNLGEKLTPTFSADPARLTDPAARKKQELDNHFFGTAIQAWNDHRYDEAVKLFAEHLQSFPESPWAAESMLHIGCHHQYVARFSESVEWFDKILASAPTDTEMYHKAKLRRTILNIDLGRLDDATKGFSEMMRDDPDPKHQSYASYWLIQTELLRKNETALRDCGQKALSHAAKVMGNGDAAADLYQLTAAGPHGFTAEELNSTALRHGLEPYPVRADTALDKLPVPFIAHYKDRHYVTVESVSGDVVKLYDSRISASTEMPRASFEKNWSGFALLMKPAPAVDGIHKAEDLKEIVGGCCGQPTQPGDLGEDDDDDCDKSCGLPTYSVNPINMNFKVKDTPLWWDAPVGPSVYMTLLFNSQDSLNNYIPFGEKWSFKYASYLLITPGTRVQVKDGDGKLETFPAPVGGIPNPVVYPVIYQSPPGDFRELKQTALHTFVLTKQDGTEYHYGIPVAMGGSSSVPLLLSIKDRHNNTLSVVHNANGAITSITHSALAGESWNFIYATIGGSHSRVIRIDDPFGRSCHYGYDSQGRLTSQTDMGGLAYTYGYTIKNSIDATINYSLQTAVPQLFISSITTPTGTTNILTEPADGIDSTSVTYTTAELDAGYVSYGDSYPPPGRPMWTNYRITAKDHLDYPTEYYFCGYDSNRYVRTPAQMERPYGMIRPSQGARTVMYSTLVGGKGTIDETQVIDEAGDQVSKTSSSSYSEASRLANFIPDGIGGHHQLTYNAKGKPLTLKLHSHQNPDQMFEMTYISPGNVDIDTVKRRIRNSGGTYDLITLADYAYYSNRDIQSVTDASGRTLTYTWHSNGLPQQITDSVTGDVITFAYDTNLRPYTTSVNGQVISTTVYDTEGRGTVASTLGADGRSASYEYDNLNRLTRELRSDDTFTAWQWACCYIEATREGKMDGSTEKTLRRTVSLHDKRALPLSVTETDGRTTRFVYDRNRRLSELIDPKGQVTRWVYNTADQLKEKIYPDLTKEMLSYYNSGSGRLGKLNIHTNRRGQTTTLHYEYDGKIDSIAGDASQSFNYDSWRRPYQQIQGSGTHVTSGTHTFVHDLLGRLTSLDGPWADDTVTYAYNDASRTVTRTSPGGLTRTTTGDAYGRVSSVANILGTFTRTYDGLSNQVTQIAHTGVNAGFNTTFTWHGDPLNRAIASITSSKPGATPVAKHSYTYETPNKIRTWKREAQLANPTGTTSQYESTAWYDGADQLSSVINNALPGSSVTNTGNHFVYDPTGNIASSQAEVSGSSATMTTYSHNSLNQLTAIGGSGGTHRVVVRGDTNEPATVKVKPTLASEWKNARLLEGNRFEADLDLATGANSISIQAKDGSSNVSSYTYGLTLAAAAAATPTYDLDGNMTSDGVRTYTWDRMSRLVKIAWGAGSNKTTEYKYNVLGQRSERIDKTGSTVDSQGYYLYEGKDLLCRYTGGTAAANIDRQYLAEGEQRKNSGVWASYYYNRDHLGSIREVMNSDGSIAARYDYDPYGKRFTQYQAVAYAGGCDAGYTGHATQSSPVSGQTEIVLTHYRGFDPQLGKWLSADPIGENGGMNLYGYVGNNPFILTDPLGLWEVSIYGGAGLGGYLSFGYSGGKINFDIGAGGGKGGVVNLKFGEDESSGGCDDPLKNTEDTFRIQGLATGGARLGPLGVGGSASLSAETGYDPVAGRGAWKFQGKATGDIGLHGSPMSGSVRFTETGGTGMKGTCSDAAFDGLNVGAGAGAFGGITVGFSVPLSRFIPGWTPSLP